MGAPSFMFSTLLLLLLLQLLFASLPHHCTLTYTAGGTWQLLQKSIGISAMHMQLLRNDRVIMFDRTDFGPSNLSLLNRKCRNDPTDTVLRVDCTAHSVEYDVFANKSRALMVQTDVWCSSGVIMPNGNLVFSPYRTCDLNEIPNGLTVKRWYASNHILPDGRQIIVSGRGQFNYEFIPKNIAANKINLPFLLETNDKGIENNLYPFVFLNFDGNLFIFANNQATLFDYEKNIVVNLMIPDGEPRSYPSIGSAVLLSLKNLKASPIEAEVLVCRARVMGDMTLLPNGNVLLINGTEPETAGWEQGRDPIMSSILYRPENDISSWFEVQNPTTIPRMYHSTVALLRDGRVLVSRSNPHTFYNFTGVFFRTKLSLETFSPAYLDAKFDNLRPTIIAPKSISVSVTMFALAFNTHLFSMNQRLLVLENDKVTTVGNSTYNVEATMPRSWNVAPSGFYLLFVVHQGIPSQGIWVRLRQY
ncbi:hypothetical protein ES319_D09G260100v1 [Gossypium barbadense]|uniref:Galactose oxidase-like Early set domain-containing protein n=1 Tax=Gossypium barbadense TaxID=3634 RepID=A0A5J5QDI0_GOSBA|nr:hypothetical protein ES319_D09G260100v1 [Gossypium barbadense]